MTQQHPGYEPEDIEVTSQDERRRRFGGRLRGRLSAVLGDKLKGLLTSSRFYATLAAILVQVFGPTFGLDDEMAMAIITTIAAWVIGDSVRPTDNPFTSRRFWVMISTGIVTLLSANGIGLDPELVQTIVLGIAAWIVGDSWRETLHGTAKLAQRRLLIRGWK